MSHLARARNSGSTIELIYADEVLQSVKKRKYFNINDNGHR